MGDIKNDLDRILHVGCGGVLTFAFTNIAGNTVYDCEKCKSKAFIKPDSEDQYYMTGTMQLERIEHGK